jgi:hypothetical protein
MKKFILSVALLITAILGSSAFIKKSSSGIAGYTGSPGEGTCATCHSGGTSASSGITITAVPAFSVNINSETEYVPGADYQITIETAASGFSKYGFGCEILTPSVTNSGTMSAPGSGVKFLNSGAKRNAVHTSAKNGSSAQFTFNWKAPANGDATIYAIGNAVNGANGDNGDFVIAPVSLNLVSAPIPLDTANSVNLKKQNSSPLSGVSVFPNPAEKISQISYYLRESSEIRIELVSMNGSLIKVLYQQQENPGAYTQILNFQNVTAGVYFIKISANYSMSSQKLIVVP